MFGIFSRCCHSNATAVSYLGEHTLTSGAAMGSVIVDITCLCGWGQRFHVPIPELETYRQLAGPDVSARVRTALIERFGAGFSTHGKT